MVRMTLYVLLFFLISAPGHALRPMHESKSSQTNIIKEIKGRNPKEREVFARNYLLSKNKPIDFHGQIVDQNGNFVSNVNIRYEIAYEDGLVRYEGFAYDKGIVKSDARGEFHIHRDKGLGLTILSMEKDGYEFLNKGFWGHVYAEDVPGRPQPVISTSSSPYVFKAYKRRPAEPLLVGEQSARLDPNGKPTGIDLVSRTVHRDQDLQGDLIISLERPIDASVHTPYAWKVKITLPAGGIIPTDDLFMNEAPEGRYEQTWIQEINPDPSVRNNRELKKRFFIKMRNGKMYGAAEMEFMSLYNLDSSAVFMNFRVNPQGSRNLQVESDKVISKELLDRVGLEKAIEEVKNQK